MIPNKKYIEDLINDKIRPIVIETRNELAQSYNVVDESSSTYRYRGLCDTACAIVKEKIEEEFKKSELDIKCELVHGEQKHTPRIKSEFWILQHTWLNVTISKDIICHIYIDPTCEQFRTLYNFSRAMFIEQYPPEWFYPDYENPLFSPMGQWINDLIHFKHKAFVEGMGKVSVQDGIVEFCQYEIWGRISDCIRLIRNSKMKKKCKKQGIEYKEVGGRI